VGEPRFCFSHKEKERSSSYAVATDEEVKAAAGSAPLEIIQGTGDPGSGNVLVLKQDDVVTGVITAGQVLSFNVDELVGFLEDARPEKKTVEALLVLAGEVQVSKKVKAVLKDYAESNG
jgi:hypothetical protein